MAEPTYAAQAWATQLRTNVATVASRWRHCDDLADQAIEPHTSRTDRVGLATELIGRHNATQAEMGIYRDNLSAIVIGDNFLPIIVIAQDSFDLSITDIAFVIYFVIADQLSAINNFLCTQCSK